MVNWSIKQAVRLNLYDARTRNTLGMVYGNLLGRWPDAIEHYRQAIRLKPDFAEALDNLGMVYTKLATALGAADKAAIQRVEVPPCQLPDSGT